MRISLRCQTTQKRSPAKLSESSKNVTIQKEARVRRQKVLANWTKPTNGVASSRILDGTAPHLCRKETAAHVRRLQGRIFVRLSSSSSAFSPPLLKPRPVRALLRPLPSHPLPLPSVPLRRDRFPRLPLWTHPLPPPAAPRMPASIHNKPRPHKPPVVVDLPHRAPELPLLPLVIPCPLRESQLAPAQPRRLAVLRVHPVRDHVDVRLSVPVRHDQRLVPLKIQRLEALRCRPRRTYRVAGEHCGSDEGSRRTYRRREEVEREVSAHSNPGTRRTRRAVVERRKCGAP